MKKYLLFLSIILLASCSTNNTATDSQRSWCISKEIKTSDLMDKYLKGVSSLTQKEQDYIKEYSTFLSTRNI